jgi:hypothetical protein
MSTEFFVNRDGSIAAQIVSGVAVSVMGVRAWTAQSFREYLDFVVSKKPELQQAIGGIAYAAIHRLSAVERRATADVLSDLVKNEHRTVVLTESAAIRMVTNSLSVLLRMARSHVALRAMAPADIDLGIGWLRERGPVDRDAVIEALIGMMHATGYDQGRIAKIEGAQRAARISS